MTRRQCVLAVVALALLLSYRLIFGTFIPAKAYTNPTGAAQIVELAKEAESNALWSEARALYTRLLTENFHSPESFHTAKQGLLRSYSNSVDLPLTGIDMVNGSFENDTDDNGLADGWGLSLNSVTPPAVYISGQEILKNGSFSGYHPATGLPLGWKVLGSGLKITTLPEGERPLGARALEITSDSNAGIYQTITGLEANRRYHFTCMVEGSALIAVDPAGNDNLADKTSWITSARETGLEIKGWKQKELTFKALGPKAHIIIQGADAGGFVANASLGVRGGYRAYGASIQSAPADSNKIFDGKRVQVIDFSPIRGGSNTTSGDVVLSQTVKGCQSGKGYLFRVPLLFNTSSKPGSFEISVGIDPTSGDGDYRSADIVWSDSVNSDYMKKRFDWPLLNNDLSNCWRPFFVSAKAASPEIKLFVKVRCNPAKWSGTGETLLLVDDARLYASDDEIVTNGYARGSNGLDLPAVWASFAISNEMAKRAKTSDIAGTWAKVWLSQTSFELANLASASRDMLVVLSDSSSIHNAELKGWALYTKAIQSYMTGSKSASKQLRVVSSDEDLPEYIRSMATLRFGHLALSSNKYGEARKILASIADNQSVALPPSVRGLANFLLGTSYYELSSVAGDSSASMLKACEYFEKAIPDLKDLPPILTTEAYYYSSVARIRNGQNDDAIIASEKGIAFKGDSGWLTQRYQVLLRTNLAHLYEKRGQIEKARSIYTEVENSPEYIDCVYLPYLMLWHLEMECKHKNDQNAGRLANEIISKWPGDPVTYQVLNLIKENKIAVL